MPSNPIKIHRRQKKRAQKHLAIGYLEFSKYYYVTESEWPQIEKYLVDMGMT